MSGTGTFVVDPVGPACWAVGLVSGTSHRCSIALGYGEFRRPGGHLGHLFVVFLCSCFGVSGVHCPAVFGCQHPEDSQQKWL